MLIKPLSGLKATLMVASVCFMQFANAAISLDRTRVIFNGDEKSLALNITNENQQLPYLAQVWLEDSEHKKITTGPLVVTPPVQRMEAGGKSQVRIMTVPAISNLPKDRESLFYFNLREIPPKSEKPNVLQIALQTQVKLFYRPVAIKTAPNTEWQKNVVVHRESGGVRISNPTPYYVTIIGLGNSKKEAETGKFDAVMLAPKSDEKIKSAEVSTPWLTFIDDYGGRPSYEFKCTGQECKASKNK